MDEQEGKEKQIVQAVKSRPGTFGLSTKLNSLQKDDSIKKDEEDDEQKKNSSSKSTLEKLLEEEERRHALARESTGSVIYDYDEPVTIPYSVQVQESESATDDDSSATTVISQHDVGEGESHVSDDTAEASEVTEATEDFTEATGDTTKSVPEQTSDEGNHMSYSSESYTLEVSNGEDEYDDLGNQSDGAMGLTDDERLFTNSKLSDTKNSLEILQITLANTETTPVNEDVEDIDDPDNAQDNEPKKRLSSFLRKLFSGGKKKGSE